MRYFLVVQDSVKDDDVVIVGPFNSAALAQQEAEEQYDPEDGWIFTVLQQSGLKFTQAFQAVFKEVPKFPWK
jgi:hypothetical protein